MFDVKEEENEDDILNKSFWRRLIESYKFPLKTSFQAF